MIRLGIFREERTIRDAAHSLGTILVAYGGCTGRDDVMYLGVGLALGALSGERHRKVK